MSILECPYCQITMSITVPEVVSKKGIAEHQQCLTCSTCAYSLSFPGQSCEKCGEFAIGKTASQDNEVGWRFLLEKTQENVGLPHILFENGDINPATNQSDNATYCCTNCAKCYFCEAVLGNQEITVARIDVGHSDMGDWRRWMYAHKACDDAYHEAHKTLTKRKWKGRHSSV
jgi:hypothetical protein